MKYDDASWHSGGDFPKNLPSEAGGTHIALFVAWALLSDLAGAIHTEEFPDDLLKLKQRELTPGSFFFRACDGKFTDEDLNDEGNAFAQSYFDSDNGRYLKDYEEVLGADLPTLYNVPDTWESFDRLRPRLDSRLAAWRAGAA